MDDYSESAECFTAFANAQGVPPAMLAAASAGSHTAVTAPIIGVRNVTQPEPSLDASSFAMALEITESHARGGTRARSPGGVAQGLAPNLA
ncbi:MAG: hypothetical protein OXH85_08065 [Truepera sp.]|nr:hypothetical protein [Truepera sp.]